MNKIAKTHIHKMSWVRPSTEVLEMFFENPNILSQTGHIYSLSPSCTKSLKHTFIRCPGLDQVLNNNAAKFGSMGGGGVHY